MFTKTHQGIIKKTVVLEFENGYKITLQAGVETCMHLVMDEAQIENFDKKCVCGHSRDRHVRPNSQGQICINKDCGCKKFVPK